MIQPPRPLSTPTALVAMAVAGSALAQWDPANGEWGKSDADDIRVMTWNVEDAIRSENPLKGDQLANWNACARILAGLRPDILIIQEAADNGCGGCVDSIADLETTIDLLFNGGADPFVGGTVTTYVKRFAPDYDLPFVFVSSANDGFNRNVILSRFPFSDLNGDGIATNSDFFVLADAYAPTGNVIRGHAFAEIDLPDATYAGDLIVGNAHFKAGGTSSDRADRLEAAQVVAYAIDYLFNGAGGGLPDPNNKILFPNPPALPDADTPVIWGGDWNEDELTNGRKGPAEWMTRAEFTGGTDGTDRDRSDSTFDDARDPFTNSRNSRGSSKLDYLAWQDSVVEGVSRQFIFNSNSVDTIDQLPEPVRGFPASGELASAFASDHFPVVVDFRLPLAEAGPCNPADLAEPFGILDLADINAFTTGFISQGPAGDFDGNGIFDLTDINLFVASFVVGCP
jgi:endonuclease/exonuclease/phosphatase family metal-dependent hydrolase